MDIDDDCVFEVIATSGGVATDASGVAGSSRSTASDKGDAKSSASAASSALVVNDRASRKLVLVGGGHANVQVVKKLRKLPGFELTLISESRVRAALQSICASLCSRSNRSTLAWFLA